MSFHRPRALSAFTSIAALFPAFALAGVAKDLPYPTGSPTADQIAEQVYYVNHFYGYRNFAIVKDKKIITVLINKAAGKKPTTNTLERFLNNDYSKGDIKAMDLAIFRSGKLRGTGMLITDYVDDAKSQSYMIWLPALRKIRRFAQPAHDDAWGGTDFTFGDVVLRKPQHETHELMGKETFNDCLGAIEIPENERSRWTKNLPDASCNPKGKEVYKVKSTTKFDNWWYDYRISYVDTESFADYRSEYFKGDQKIKVIDRDWRNQGLDDPRALAWGYWYGKTFSTDHETWAVIPEKVIRIDSDYKADLWSEKTLRKIKR
jgi:hypothetical protein